ncbi:MAG: flagellar export protein FliJ [Clostridiales bacterium]|jgi:flagellar FliJ protein|nr:flagellar export protein FliJ [Clostridiales bacterium]
MKKFRYRMESILQLKIKLEEQAKITYSAARMRLNMEEQKLAQMNKQKESYEDRLRGLRSSRLDLVEIRRCEDAIKIMQYKIEHQKYIVKEAEKRLEAERIKLKNAMAERKTQDKLKEKAFEEYKIEFEAEERKEADELNSFRYSNITLGEEDR